MTVGIVIVTHNNAHTITACLQSVQPEGVSSVVVVDSNSTDVTLGAVGSQCEVIRLQENRGFGYAANIGARVMNTDCVLFLNPDAQLTPGTVALLLDTMSSQKNTGVVGALLMDSKGVPEADAHGMEPTLWSMFARHIVKNSAAQSGVVVADWVSGGALLVRSDVFRSIGGFDESFFLYWEDVDICRRVRDKGYVIYMNADARVQHVRGGSGLSLKEKTRLYDKAANRYFQKHHSLFVCQIHLLLRKIYRLLRPSVR